MSLYKRSQFWLVVLLLLLMLVAFKINLDCTRRLTISQLSYSTKNIADLTALALGPQLSGKAQLESKINWIFDSGNYKEVTLIRLDGSVVYQRQSAVGMDTIPFIFKGFTTIDPPAAEAEVFDEGGRFGMLRIKLHPDPFYAELWTVFKQLCLLFLFAGLVVVSGGYLISSVYLKTLNRIKTQAEGISKNDYIINKNIPETPELRAAALAMNTMVQSVQSNFNRQLEDIKHFQQLQFFDGITGLHNRKFLIKQLRHFLDSDTEKAYGHFFLVGIMGMEKNNISIGHPDIRAFYKRLADSLAQTVSVVENAVTARLSQQEFGVILPDCNTEKATAVARTAVSVLQTVIDNKLEFCGLVKLRGGLAAYNYRDDAGSVLSKTDYALSAAKSDPGGTFEIFNDENDQVVMGKYEWQTMLHSALTNERFILFSQPVVFHNGELHREIYINFADSDGKVYKAGYFMPMAISLGLAGRIDKYVFERAVQHLKNMPARTLAVNITNAFCKDRLAGVWLRQFLTANQSVCGQLYVEIHDNNLTQYPDLYFDLAKMLKRMGVGVGLDQFSLNDTSLNLLKEIKPAYVKIEKDYFQDIENSHGNTETALNSLISLTDNLDTKLIVTKIEDEKMYRALLSKRVKYFQGLAIAPITPLDDSP